MDSILDFYILPFLKVQQWEMGHNPLDYFWNMMEDNVNTRNLRKIQGSPFPWYSQGS